MLHYTLLGLETKSVMNFSVMLLDLNSGGYPEYARRWGISHILADKGGVSFTLFKKMHENSIVSPITGGVRCVRPMLDPPLLRLTRLNLTSITYRHSNEAEPGN